MSNQETLWSILKSEDQKREDEFVRLLNQQQWTTEQLDARKSGELTIVSITNNMMNSINLFFQLTQKISKFIY